ncbi:ATP-binding protein, partial [Vibrio harveyi]|uniref:ATP-binding protein n=1 Tax=Vibrio harveyi TaxID=669 RepID=UPI000E06E80B
MTTINLENKDDIIIDTDGYEIQIDMNVLNHLGMSLYSNTPAVLTEIISNAWDADANEVTINLDKANSEVVITDDGHGMTKEHIINRFLKVGYARRNDKREKSDSGKRQVMGRKGIGKLAMFSLAGKIQVTSKTIDSNATGFEIDVEELQRCIKKGEPYKAKPITLEFD